MTIEIITTPGAPDVIIAVETAVEIIDTAAQGPIGPPGRSAYTTAVAEGFVGTEIEWLASLVGPTGPGYTHPVSHPPSIITQDASNRFVTDAEKTAWNAKQPAGTYATGTGSAEGVNTGDQVIPTTLPASDVYAWAKAATKPSYTATEVANTPTGNIVAITVQAAINELDGDKAPVVHAHNDLYFTEAEVTTALGLKSDTTHNHTGVYQPAGTYATGTGTASGVNTGDQDLSVKQDTLVSGTNIKTLNGGSLLGSGNVVIVGGVTVSATAPSNPTNGQGWFNLNIGVGFIWVDDGDSSAWVESGSVGTATIASVVGLQAALDAKASPSVANTWTTGQRGAYATLTSTAASVAVNLADSPKFTHTLTENTVIAAPTSPLGGQGIDMELIQHASAAKTVGFNTFYHFVGTVPTISTTLSSRSRLVGTVRSTADGADVSLQGPFV